MLKRAEAIQLLFLGFDLELTGLRRQKFIDLFFSITKLKEKDLEAVKYLIKHYWGIEV